MTDVRRCCADRSMSAAIFSTTSWAWCSGSKPPTTSGSPYDIGRAQTMTSSRVPPVARACPAAQVVAFALSGEPSTPTTISGRITSVSVLMPFSSVLWTQASTFRSGGGTVVGPCLPGSSAPRLRRDLRRGPNRHPYVLGWRHLLGWRRFLCDFLGDFLSDLFGDFLCWCGLLGWCCLLGRLRLLSGGDAKCAGKDDHPAGNVGVFVHEVARADAVVAISDLQREPSEQV